MVIDIEIQAVPPISDVVAPSDGQFPSVSPHVSDVLQRSARSDKGRKLSSGRKHSLGVAPVPVKRG